LRFDRDKSLWKMSKERILVVEDERIVAEDIKLRLNGLAYTVCGIAFSGEEAVKKIGEMRPDLVLMDIVLQGKMNGIEAAEVIRSHFEVPVVYLTAYSDDKTLERAKMTEPFGYLLKPFEDRDLKTTIEMALYKFRMERMLRESERRYRGVVENAHDAIYIQTANGFQYVNPAFEKLTGFKKEEICNGKFNFWNCIHPDDRRVVKEQKNVRDRGEERSSNFEFRIIAKNGGVRVVDANAIDIKEDEEMKEIGILRDVTERFDAEKEKRRGLERLRRALEATINALTAAVEMRDPYTAGHQRRVTDLACSIAKEMGLPQERMEAIQMAGIIHDIGKILVPSEILSKPGKLSDAAFNIIKTHPQAGYDILKSIEFPFPVAQIVLRHHERMDGSGYPAGLSGEKILLEARILAVADVVEAMASHRPYRPVLGIDKALEEITRNKGILYDSEAVAACLRLFSRDEFRDFK
jgi:PAS domain S-box-containing protein/putative nucleotidyltransferase with HDIG domain